MLDLFKVKVKASYIVVEGLWLVLEDILLDLA